MARPKKQVSERRTQLMTISLTLEEEDTLKRKSEAAGKAPAVYARETALQSRLVMRKGRGLTPETFAALNSVGVNLNQIARTLNSGGDPHREDVLAALERINSLLDEGLAQ